MILSFDIGGTRIKYAFVDKDYTISNVNVIQTPHKIDEFVEVIQNIILELKPVQIGFSVAGIIEYATKKVKHSPNMLFLNGFSFKRFESVAKVIVENDANAACLNAYRVYKKNNMLHLTLGTGLGGGAIVNGKLLRSSISVFEVGHVTTQVAGRRCGCGNRGCIEQYTGVKHIAEYALKLGLNEEIIDIFSPNANNRYHRKVVHRFSDYLGIIVADLINIFGSELVVFSGGLANSFHIFKDRFESVVRRHSFVYRIKPCIFEFDKNPDFSGLLGIASIFNEGLDG